MFALIWLLVNVTRASPTNGDTVWENFLKCLKDFKHARWFGSDFRHYKKTLDHCLDEIKSDSPLIQQNIGEAVVEDKKLYYMSKASERCELFKKKLRDIDQHSQVNLKSENRIVEKAELDVGSGGYGGDYSGILDYLRGTVYVEVYPETESSVLGARVQEVLKKLHNAFGNPRRIKVYKADICILHRILLNYELQGHICEVQIRFRFGGIDHEDQDFVHDLYELTRKPRKDINNRTHVVLLICDLLAKLKINFSFDVVRTWLSVSTKIKFSQLKEEKKDDEERTRLIIFFTNKGLNKMEIQVKTAIEKKNGVFQTIPKDILQARQLKDVHLKTVKEVMFSHNDMTTG
eukprot:TRINITY_DN4564_c0_g1_i1.p1 TRINITY_DN4564_c0_g1~~TRINITY_DN4564_c0_g1_i1.p1  ORF type:complete len:347 (-),score=86.76 TRINITY_DN4564_c0_g1_i1:74-1114(-)